jgi:hypothetical protein
MSQISRNRRGAEDGHEKPPGVELRRRLDALGRAYTKLAPLLGLSIDGLRHQMRGYRKVTRRTELLPDNWSASKGFQSRPADPETQANANMALACPAIRGNFFRCVNYLTLLDRFLIDAA